MGHNPVITLAVRRGLSNDLNTSVTGKVAANLCPSRARKAVRIPERVVMTQLRGDGYLDITRV